MVGDFENVGMVRAIQRVRHKKPAEKQHLGHQKNPDAEFPGIELLLRPVEVMSDKRTMIVVIMVVIVLIRSVGNCHGWLRESVPRKRSGRLEFRRWYWVWVGFDKSIGCEF